MKKSILSVMLALCLAIGLLPNTALAGGAWYDYVFDGNGVRENVEHIDVYRGGGTVIDSKGEGWVWDKNTRTLTLSGANFTKDHGWMSVLLCGDATIYLTEGSKNLVSAFNASNAGAGIYCDGNLTIDGKGSLELKWTADVSGTCELSSDKSLSIKNGTISATSLAGGNQINISGGSVNVDSICYGISYVNWLPGTSDGEVELSVSDGNIEVSRVRVDTTSVSGGTLTAENLFGNLYITGGTVSVTNRLMLYQSSLSIKNGSLSIVNEDGMSIRADSIEIDNANVSSNVSLGVDLRGEGITDTSPQRITMKNVTGGEIKVSNSTSHVDSTQYHWEDIVNDQGKSSPLNIVALYPGKIDVPDEYIYNEFDSGADFTLPAEWLDDVTDTDSAVETVQNLVNIMTDEQKTSPICADLATLFAETAAAKAASRILQDSDISVTTSEIAELDMIASEASTAVEAVLESGGVTTARYLSTTVTLVTDETDITVRIDPDVLTTEVDKVRVETPSYALTFKLSDLAPDLTQPLTFTAKSSAAGSTTPSTVVSSFSSNADGQALTTISMSIVSNAAALAVEIGMTGGKTTNSITVSLPSDSGDKTYQAVASADGTATASKYNPATTQMDGKVNMSGKYTVMTNEKDFTDISNKSKEMQDAIRYLASKGIISGTTATTFNPDGSINRAEIATLLVKALGKLDTSATTSFSDVVKSNWYYSAAASSQKHGLVNGFEDNTFRGTTNINKVQIVAVSSRVLTSEMNYKAPSNPSAYLSKYKDTVANWAQSEVALATRENLVVYRTDGTFSGDKNMTRGDAAIIIYRLFQRIW